MTVERRREHGAIANVFALLLFVATINCFAAESSVPNLVRRPKPIPIPNLELQDQAGNLVDAKRWHGKYVVLNLWATWCAPCVKELPSLDKLQTILGTKEYAVVAVSQDRFPRNVVPQYFVKLKIKNLESVYDSKGHASKALRIPVLPTTLILNRKGEEVGRIVGSLDWTSTIVVDTIRDLSTSLR